MSLFYHLALSVLTHCVLIWNHFWMCLGPDGILPPVLTSLTSQSVQAVWQTAGRNNADHSPTYQLQFREPTPGYIIEK